MACRSIFLANSSAHQPIASPLLQDYREADNETRPAYASRFREPHSEQPWTAFSHINRLTNNIRTIMNFDGRVNNFLMHR